MRNECPNCGEYSFVGPPIGCGCTWDEMIAAKRIKEGKRRKRLVKEGRPVIVDFQRENKRKKQT